jgi:hypothetical protein
MKGRIEVATQQNLILTLKLCDVLCIQKHWYFSYEKNDLINISSTHETQAKSVDDYTEKENFIHGRGYGGVAIDQIVFLV